MSKSRTSFEKFAIEAPNFTTMKPYDIAVLAWNARGKVDAEICRNERQVFNEEEWRVRNELAEAIEQENQE